jgi:hypothetical protein
VPPSPQGQPVTVSTEVRLAPVPPATVGVLTAPGTILLRLKKPDGTFVVPDYTPVLDTVGKYHVDIPGLDLNVLGLYRWAWYTTGTAAGVTPRAGIINVVDPFAPAHISYEDAKARLNLTSAYDAEVQAMIDSAIAEQEQRVGAVAPRQVTDTVTAYGGRLWLPTRPVLSVASATFAGLTVSVADWRVGPPMAGYVASMSSPLAGEYVVTYTAGRQPVPQDLVEAALLRVQHSYESQRGGTETEFTDQGEGPGGSAFLLLLRAQDKEKPYVLPTVA